MSTQGNVERKLAAIMFTDIAGFTALASKDEQSALKLLKRQREVVFPIVESHKGIIHKELGDGLLISFNLTSESVKCAIEIQQSVIDIEKLNLRIGIHEGEIAISGDDVLGDDVNVAARIEPFSAVGGVSISGKVQQNISSIPEIKTDLIAKPKLKGVNQEISVFAVISDNLPYPDKSLINAKLEKSNGFSKEILLSTAFGIILFISGFGYFLSSGETEKAGIVQMKKQPSFYPEEDQIIVNQLDTLLAINDLESNDMAFDLASELVFLDSANVDYKSLLAQTLFQRGLLKDNNIGLFKKSQELIENIIDSEFLNYKRKSYAYYVRSHIEYLIGNKDLATKYIRTGLKISKSNPTVKQFWQKLNREQLKKMELNT